LIRITTCLEPWPMRIGRRRVVSWNLVHNQRLVWFDSFIAWICRLDKRDGRFCKPSLMNVMCPRTTASPTFVKDFIKSCWANPPKSFHNCWRVSLTSTRRWFATPVAIIQSLECLLYTWTGPVYILRRRFLDSFQSRAYWTKEPLPTVYARRWFRNEFVSRLR